MARKRTHISKAYWLLAFVRFLLVVIPQTGYIHPDEYFQSVEVLAGKFLEIEVATPWEFNATFPLRSMALPYFTLGMSIKALKDLNYLVKEYLSGSILTPYYLLIFPRLLMCALSFITDICLYKICVNNNEKCRCRLTLLASSYVILVFGSRTFSNTLELMLFAILLYYVSESLTYSNMLIKKREYLNYRYEKSQEPAERAKFHKLRLYLRDDSIRNAFIISTITVIGFFNRPTFVAFAVVPIFFWLYRGIGTKTVKSMIFHLRMLALIVMAIPTFLAIIITDSFYYGYITWGEVGMLEVSINSFVFTPWNFIKYNFNLKNLAQHGLHPRYLHALVNVPLLFNILAACAFGRLIQYGYHAYLRKFHLLPTIRSIKGLMSLAFLVPVILLSVFPHQEPRFLIPLIIPLVYLHGPSILPETEEAMVKASAGAIRNAHLRVKKPSYVVLKFWLAINFIFVIFFGFVHQGGVYKATQYMSTELAIHPQTEFHVVTSHIYSMPESLLIQPSVNKIYSSGNSKYTINKRFFVYEEGSKNLRLTVKKIRIMLYSIENEKKKRQNKPYKVYLLIPSSLTSELERIVQFEDLYMQERETLFPHLSTEAFPFMTDYCLDIYNVFLNRKCFKDQVLSLHHYVYKFFERCGLNVLEFSLNYSNI